MVFIRNHVVCTNSASIVSYSCQLRWWEPSPNPSSQILAKGQTGFSNDNVLRPVILTLFYTDFYRDCIDYFEGNFHLNNIKYTNH